MFVYFLFVCCIVYNNNNKKKKYLNVIFSYLYCLLIYNVNYMCSCIVHYCIIINNS